MMPPEQQESNDKLLAYFMGQTNQRLSQIDEKLLELITFRAEVLAHAKSTSISVGIACSVLTVVVNVVLRKVGL